jgi:ABC-type transport system involved in multi-copper enzyme maturation permease subunit
MWVTCNCDRCGTLYWKICAHFHHLFFVNFNEYLKRQPFGFIIWLIFYRLLNMSCFFPHLCNTQNTLIDKGLRKSLRWVFQMHISTYIQNLHQYSQFINSTQNVFSNIYLLGKQPILCCCNICYSMVLMNLVICRYTICKSSQPNPKHNSSI